MLEIINFGEPGITRWIDNLIEEIKNNPNGFTRMNKFFEDSKLDVVDIELEPKDAKKIGYTTANKFTYISEWEKRKPIWAKYLAELKYTL